MKSKNKDRKPHESIIGKIIYGFLLFMPLLAIGVTCAYAIFNKNAYQSYYGETINQNELVEVSNIENNKDYWLKPARIEALPSGTNINFSCDNTSYIINGTTTTNFDNGFFYYNGGASNNYIAVRLGNGTYTYYSCVSFTEAYLSNFYNGVSQTTRNKLLGLFYEYEYNNLSYVSEVFYYSIDKVEQSPLFNWAEDSAIYTGMTATCNALDISTTFIPLLMTYWLIISVIYILYDIILIILHIFHKKIHQLEDSF